MDLKSFIIDPKDITRILFGASGRLNPTEFAQGLVFIVVVGWAIQILTLIPGLALVMGLVGLVVGLVFLFAWICIFSKRFHDAGKSGWLTVAAIIAAIVISFIVSLVLGPIFGGSSIASMSDLMAAPTITIGSVLMNMLSAAIVNGSLGFYMYRLPATSGS